MGNSRKYKRGITKDVASSELSIKTQVKVIAAMILFIVIAVLLTVGTVDIIA